VFALCGRWLLAIGYGTPARLAVECTDVLAAGNAFGGLALLHTAHPVGTQFMVGKKVREVWDANLGERLPQQAFVGGWREAGHAALQTAPGTWTLVHGNPTELKKEQLAVPAGKVVGMAALPGQSPSGLAVVSEAGRLAIIAAETVELPAPSTPIVSACVSRDGMLVAWLTEAGEIVVFSLGYNQPLLVHRAGTTLEGAGT